MEIVLNSFDENVGMFGFEGCEEVSGVSICEFSELDASEKVFELMKDSELNLSNVDLEESLAKVFYLSELTW
jgi:hypothetical protein